MNEEHRMSLTYAATGVDYDALDPFKRLAQRAARETAGNVAHRNDGEFREFELSRGESAYLIESADGYVAHTEEGLGTKNLVADAMYRLTGRSYYDQIAQCTVATIVNDLVTLGALPLSVAMHLAVGSSDWFNDKRRAADLVNGWKRACDLARCTWGGGETPTLKGIVMPEAAVLSGSAIGIVKPKERLISDRIQHGDAIVLVESAGVHANGLTMVRALADRLADGYLTPLPDGRTFGETILDPTHIYVGVVEDCLEAGVDIHYAVHVTGHGWRKLMRSRRPFTYVVNTLPAAQPIFAFLQQHGPIDDREAYGNFNMGAGFALYVPEAEALHVEQIVNRLGLRAFVAGHIESGPKEVRIVPKGLTYAGETLAVR